MATQFKPAKQIRGKKLKQRKNEPWKNQARNQEKG